MVGHTLSAAGAVEAVFTLLTMQEERLPPTINYAVPDPAIALDVVPNVAGTQGSPCYFQLVRIRRPERFFGHGARAGLDAFPMRALTLIADRKLELRDVPPPPPPGPGEVQVRVKAVALNHLDLWGFRGMAFAKRQMPLVVGVEAAGEIAGVGTA